MQVSAQYAREHFDELLNAEPGQEFEISQDGRPTAKLIIMPVKERPAEPRREIILGAGRGEIVLPTDEEWKAMKEEGAAYWDKHNLMTSGEV